MLLETLVVPAAIEAGLEPVLVMVNDQVFTKTANCWGVSNSSKGTNTNRIILLRNDSTYRAICQKKVLPEDEKHNR